MDGCVAVGRWRGGGTSDAVGARDGVIVLGGDDLLLSLYLLEGVVPAAVGRGVTFRAGWAIAVWLVSILPLLGAVLSWAAKASPIQSAISSMTLTTFWPSISPDVIWRNPWPHPSRILISTQSSSSSYIRASSRAFRASSPRNPTIPVCEYEFEPKFDIGTDVGPGALVERAARSSARLARFASRNRPPNITVSSTKGSFSPQSISTGGKSARR